MLLDLVFGEYVWGDGEEGEEGKRGKEEEIRGDVMGGYEQIQGVGHDGNHFHSSKLL